MNNHSLIPVTASSNLCSDLPNLFSAWQMYWPATDGSASTFKREKNPASFFIYAQQMLSSFNYS